MDKKPAGVRIVLSMVLVFLAVFCLNPGLTTADVEEMAAVQQMPSQQMMPRRHVRVGYYITPGFQEYDAETDTYRGYSYEYLLALAQFTNWEYEFVPVSFSEGIGMLERGEIDLMNNVSFLKTREDTLAFSDLPSGRSYTVMVMLPNRPDEVAYEDFDRFNELTFGIVKGRSYDAAFRNYARQHGFTPKKLIYYDSSDEARSAWQRGEVDVYIGPSTYNMDYHILGKFYPEEFYIAVAKGNTQLKWELDTAMNTLTTEDAEFVNRLYHKYYSNIGETNTTLTDAEQAFLQEHPVIPVIYDTTFYPVSYQDEKGEFAGAMRALYDLIAQKTGLQFRYEAHTADLPEVIKGVDQRNFIVAEIPYDYRLAYQLGVNITPPFTSVTCMKVSRSSTEDGGRMAVIQGNFLGKLCQSVYRDKYTYVSYPDAKACIDAVLHGEVDATCLTSYEYEHYSAQSEYRHLTYKVAGGLDYQLGIAVAKSADPRLQTILTKAIGDISDEEIYGIMRQATLVAHKPDLSMLIYTHPEVAYPIIGVVVVLLMIAIGAGINRHLARKNEAVMRQKNKQLKDAIDLANSASTSKSRFLAQMSHEIRTPMNAIVGMTAMAQKYVHHPAKTSEYLHKIDTASKLLLSIINDILDMSAIESNKLKIAQEVFDLKGILTGVSTIYYGQCSDKGIYFTMRLHDLEHELFIGDALRVNQILMNLVSNAFKFTPAGGSITIEVFEKKASDGKVFIRFMVSDTGCGMSEDLQKRLFRAFEQESATTAQKHGGSGLGLAITKNLITMMHGAVTVKSELGKGTTFTVNLPFELPTEHIDPDTHTLDNLYALVVDDDEGVIEYTGEVLQRMGIRYDAAASAEEALTLIERNQQQAVHYDVCLVDWKLPGMDGVELVRRIRQISDDDTLIIIISAYDLSEVEDEARQAGADLYIGKPFFQSSLFNALMTTQHQRRPKSAAKMPLPAPAEETGPFQYDFTGHKVLLAEDFELNREVAMDLFEEVNLDADCAENGREAVEMFEASAPGTYGMILMDIQMPEMDGLEATRRIRQSIHPEAATIPIYAMSANAFSEDVAESLNAGMNGHIAKPIDTDALYKILQRVLKEEKL